MFYNQGNCINYCAYCILFLFNFSPFFIIMGQPTFDNKSHDLAASGFGTRAIHAGHVPDGLTGAVIPPISLSTTFKQTAAGVHKVISISIIHAWR